LIAENLDNINDASRKIESLDGLQTLMEKLESVPSRLKRLDAVKDRLEDVEKKLDGALVSKESPSPLAQHQGFGSAFISCGFGSRVRNICGSGSRS